MPAPSIPPIKEEWAMVSARHNAAAPTGLSPGRKRKAEEEVEVIDLTSDIEEVAPSGPALKRAKGEPRPEKRKRQYAAEFSILDEWCEC
jgi:hypothetical protein